MCSITHKGGDSEKLIVAAAVSPDGKWAATSDTGKNVFIWDAATGDKVSSWCVMAAPLEAFAAIPDLPLP